MIRQILALLFCEIQLSEADICMSAVEQGIQASSQLQGRFGQSIQKTLENYSTFPEIKVFILLLVKYLVLNNQL